MALMTVVAFVRLRRASKRLDRLAESYWQVRYEQGQMSARLARLEKGLDPAEPPVPAAADRPQTAFVPLSSLRKSP
jgi:hypothetical protein